MKKISGIKITVRNGGQLMVGILSIILLAGCLKYDKLVSPADNKVFMPQAASDRGILTLFKIDSVQTVYFGATIAGFTGNHHDIQVRFAVDTTLVTAYNEEYGYLGKHYEVLPATAYSIDELSTKIPAGSSSAVALPIKVQASRLNSSLDYMLPLKIASVSEGVIDSALGVTYFRIDSLQIRSRDITGKGLLSVSNENTSGPTGKQGSSFVIDGDVSTKFFCPDYNDNFWIKLKFDEPLAVDAYTLTSANDRPDRDPRTWQLQASVDGQTWIALDSRENYTFTDRLTEGYFEVDHEGGSDDGNAGQHTFQYYRLHITQNNGGGSQFQLAELRLLQYY